jgi:hypothetical protein
METFEQFATRWKETILPLKKPATQSTLGSHIRFLNQKLGSRPLPDIAYSEVQAMFSELAKDQMPRSVKTPRASGARLEQISGSCTIS